MKVKGRVMTGDEVLGLLEYDVDKRTRLRDVERFITREIAGEEFRRIALIEDFMRAVFSTPITVPLQICHDAPVLATLSEHGKVWLNFLFERKPLVFELTMDDIKGEEADREKIRELMYSSGHYAGMYITPGISIEDLSEFVNRRKALPVNTDSIPEDMNLKVIKGRKKKDLTARSETTFLEIAMEVFRTLGMEENAYFYVYKGKRDECLLLMEYPPYAVWEGFSRVRLGEMVAAFKGEMVLAHEEGDVLLIVNLD